MAVIRIRPRRPRATWPWLLVLILPFAYLLTIGRTSDATARALSTNSASAVIPRDTAPPPDPIALLTQFAESPDSAAKASTRLYAAAGLDRTIAALQLLGASAAPSNQQALVQIHSDRDRVGDVKDVTDMVASDRMHDAAVKIADVIESANVGGHHGADAQTTAVRVAAGDIRTTGGLEAQRAQVQTLLLATARAISAMHPITH